MISVIFLVSFCCLIVIIVILSKKNIYKNVLSTIKKNKKIIIIFITILFLIFSILFSIFFILNSNKVTTFAQMNLIEVEIFELVNEKNDDSKEIKISDYTTIIIDREEILNSSTIKSININYKHENIIIRLNKKGQLFLKRYTEENPNKKLCLFLDDNFLGFIYTKNMKASNKLILPFKRHKRMGIHEYLDSKNL